jgi:hypothetical protein
VNGSVLVCGGHKNDPISFHCKEEDIYECMMCIVKHLSHADGNLTPLKESSVLE